MTASARSSPGDPHVPRVSRAAPGKQHIAGIAVTPPGHFEDDDKPRLGHFQHGPFALGLSACASSRTVDPERCLCEWPSRGMMREIGCGSGRALEFVIPAP